jgi:hypothetical protein
MRQLVLMGIPAFFVLAVTAYQARADGVSYVYDDIGRLKKAIYTVGSGTTTITYNYDSGGNRIQKTVSCSGPTC